MGLYHGLYCLGCCWAYFLLMVALGWMNLLWMGLFAGIIFGEKMWSRGIWVARAAGIGLAVVGILVSAGMLPSLVSSAESMTSSEDETGNEMMMMESSTNNNNNHITMDSSNPEASMNMSDDSMPSNVPSDESPQTTSNYDGQTMESMNMNNNSGAGQAQMTNME
jgi:hypothetical protein